MQCAMHRIAGTLFCSGPTFAAALPLPRPLLFLNVDTSMHIIVHNVYGCLLHNVHRKAARFFVSFGWCCWPEETYDLGGKCFYILTLKFQMSVGLCFTGVVVQVGVL